MAQRFEKHQVTLPTFTLSCKMAWLATRRSGFFIILFFCGLGGGAGVPRPNMLTVSGLLAHSLTFSFGVETLSSLLRSVHKLLEPFENPELPQTLYPDSTLALRARSTHEHAHLP